MNVGFLPHSGPIKPGLNLESTARFNRVPFDQVPSSAAVTYKRQINTCDHCSSVLSNQKVYTRREK